MFTTEKRLSIDIEVRYIGYESINKVALKPQNFIIAPSRPSHRYVAACRLTFFMYINTHTKPYIAIKDFDTTQK